MKLDLLPIQARLLSHNADAAGLSAWHLCLALLLDGHLDATALGLALVRLRQLHAPLRTRLEMQEGLPVQIIAGDSADDGIAAEDLADGVPADERYNAALAEAREESCRPFSFGESLFRARLMRLASDRHLLVLTMHQAIADPFSMVLTARHMRELYLEVPRGSSSALRTAIPRWQDYVARQLQDCSDGRVDRVRCEPFAAEIGPALFLPRAISDRLDALAAQTGTSVAMLLLAAFGATLSDCLNMPDPIVTRVERERDMESAVGPVETKIDLPLRVSRQTTLRELIDQMAAITPPTEDSPGPQPARPQWTMRIEPTDPWTPATPPSLAVAPIHIPTALADEELSWLVQMGAFGWSGTLIYAPERFDRPLIDRHVTQIAALLTLMATDPAATEIAPTEHFERTRRTERETRVGASGRSQLESQLAIVWARALGLPFVGLDEYFFDLGGHSLMLPKLQEHIEAVTGLSFEIGLILQYPTVRKFAAYCFERIQLNTPTSRDRSRSERRKRRLGERRDS